MTEEPQTGDEVSDEQETRLRTMFITYEAADQDADTFMIVVGSVAENFRGVNVTEFQDDTIFAEGGDNAFDVLHTMATAEGRLTAEQRATLAAFSEAIAEWDGSESP